MERFNSNIRIEIESLIKKWNKREMNINEIEEYFDNCCSVWDGYYDLKFYIDEDGEEISIDELKKSSWCRELSDGRVIMFG